MTFPARSRLGSHPSRFAKTLLLLGLAGVAGCKDRGMAVYRVDKDLDNAAVPPPPAATPAPVVAQASPGLHWVAPSGWQAQKADGLRTGSFLVPGADGAKADVSIVTFPGSGGDDLANINRWRGQLQLVPVTAAELPAQVQSLATPAGTMAVVDLTGTAGEAKAPVRLLGAWLRSPERVWFFKLMGPAPLVAAQRDVFTAFLQTVTMTAGAVEAAAPPAAPAGRAGTIPPVADGPVLRWQAPAGWSVKAASAMRKGSYAVGAAEVAITVFPGDVGGVLANVNRWRGQVGLDPVDDAALAGITTPVVAAHGLHFIVTDAAGPAAGGPRIVAALVPWQGRTWFFKLTGPGDAVAAAKPAFLAFLQTVEAP